MHPCPVPFLEKFLIYRDLARFYYKKIRLENFMQGLIFYFDEVRANLNTQA
jgi:hypothetical protein